jgi:hypothetical protein
MYKTKYAAIGLVIVAALFLGGPALDAAARPLAVHSPTLGVANSFVILAAAGITDGNVANTTISGDVGNSGGGGQITDITCANMAAGTIYKTDAGGPAGLCVVDNSAVPGQAQVANTAAYGDLSAGDNSGCASIPVELGGQSLPAGIYCPEQGNFQITGPTPLSLTGTGVWIFRTFALTVGPNAQVVGSDPCNVWWELATDGTAASIDTGADMIGNMLALGSITFGDGASLVGRAFSQIGQVTLIGNDITNAVCVTTTGGGGDDEERRDRNAQVSGLPNTGGAPIRNAEFPWGLLIVGGMTAGALILGARASQRKNLSRK